MINKLQTALPNIFIRIDKKDLINELRAMKDNYVELWINTNNLSTLIIKDRFKTITTKTRNERRYKQWLY